MSEATTEAPYQLGDLAGLATPDPETWKRVAVVRAPGLTVLHLALAPGQRVPLHRHPGHHVVLQGLSGLSTVQLDEEVLALGPQALLAFAGERAVSPYNDGDAPSALLITLARRSSEAP